MESTPICYIDRIPNEILRIVFSFLTPSNDSFKWYDSPILAVRCASRRFRIIANDLEFWREGLFDIADLFQAGQGRPLARRTRKLLNDNDLKLVLSRRTEWQFSTIQSLFAVATSVPELCQNTRKVFLREFENSLEIAIDYMAAFTALTELTIEFNDDCDDADFDGIVDCCPLLTTLVLMGLPEASGSLNGAANLRKLVLIFWETQSAYLDSNLLPFKSAQTLESIDITIWGRYDILGDSKDFTLDRFVNLAHFETTNLNLLTWEILTHGKFTLTNLDVTYCRLSPGDPVDLIPFESLLSMFDAPSLKSLRRLQFSFPYARCADDPEVPIEQRRDEGNQLVSAIGTNFEDLENLELDTEFCTSQLKSFAKLRYLKSITLRVGLSFIHFDDYDGTQCYEKTDDDCRY